MKQTGHPYFYKLLREIEDLHNRKNADYRTVKDPLGNFKMCEQMGVSPFVGCCVRISDKYARLSNLMSKGYAEVKEETVEDTLKDLAVYSLIAICLLKEKNGKQVDKKGR